VATGCRALVYVISVTELYVSDPISITFAMYGDICVVLLSDTVLCVAFHCCFVAYRVVKRYKHLYHAGCSVLRYLQDPVYTDLLKRTMFVIM